jgi:hypothetical protein
MIVTSANQAIIAIWEKEMMSLVNHYLKFCRNKRSSIPTLLQKYETGEHFVTNEMYMYL